MSISLLMMLGCLSRVMGSLMRLLISRLMRIFLLGTTEGAGCLVRNRGSGCPSCNCYHIESRISCID